MHRKRMNLELQNLKSTMCRKFASWIVKLNDTYHAFYLGGYWNSINRFGYFSITC